MLPSKPSKLHEVRTVANRAPLYIPTHMTFPMLFEPCLFDPYFSCRREYLKAAGFYDASEEHIREILLVARLRMENFSRAGFVPSLPSSAIVAPQFRSVRASFRA